MGCDIHLYVEKKIDGRWTPIDGPNPYFGKFEWETNSTQLDWLYNGRNYNLFAILADVRNGVGFAGIDTGDGFIPIDMPRGLPDDVSKEIRKQSREWGVDGHSHSHFTLRELLAYNWEQSTKIRGVVSAEEFKKLDARGRPTGGYSGGVSGRMVRNVSREKMEAITHGGIPNDGYSYYCPVEWEQSYYESAGSFVTDAIPKLKELADGDPDSVRIVFWFDN